MSNLKYVQSRIYSQYKDYPFGSSIKAKNKKTGEDVKFNIYPDKYIEKVDTSSLYLLKPYIPDVEDKWDTHFLSDKGYFHVNLEDFDKYYIEVEGPNYTEDFFFRLISDDKEFYAFAPTQLNAYYGTIFNDKVGVTFTKIDTTLVFKPDRVKIGIEGKSIKHNHFSSDPLALYFLTEFLNGSEIKPGAVKRELKGRILGT